jgi:hypothetical protein
MQIYQNTKVCISITLQLSLIKSASVAEKRINWVFINAEYKQLNFESITRVYIRTTKRFKDIKLKQQIKSVLTDDIRTYFFQTWVTLSPGVFQIWTTHCTVAYFSEQRLTYKFIKEKNAPHALLFKKHRHMGNMHIVRWPIWSNKHTPLFLLLQPSTTD